MKRLLSILVSFFSIGFVVAQEYTDIKVSQLPKAAQAYIADNFKGTQPSRVVRIDDKGTVNYGVVFESDGRKKVLGFDKDGKFVRKGDKPGGAKQEPWSTNPAATATAQPAANTTTAIAADKLPANIHTYIKTTYPAGKIVISNQQTENKVVFYQVTVLDGNKSHVMTFDSKGKYLNEQTFIKQ